MKKEDIKKALAFIKEKAVESPKTTRQGSRFTIPKEIVNEIRQEIVNHEGSFGIDAVLFNNIFSWSEKSRRSSFMQNKLNDDYPCENDGEQWYVGTRSTTDGDFYVFSIGEVKTEVKDNQTVIEQPQETNEGD